MRLSDARVVVAGHLCVDLIPDLVGGVPRPGELVEVGPLRVRLGGCVANAGRAMASFGASPTLHARVGRDFVGELAREQAASLGVGTALEVDQNLGTSFSVVLQPPAVDRSFLHHVGANGEFDGSGLSIDGVDAIHIGYPQLLPGLIRNGGEGMSRLLAEIRASGALGSVDFAVTDSTAQVTVDAEMVERWAPHIDVLGPSVDDLVSVSGWEQKSGRAEAEWATYLVSMGATIAMVTDGGNGLAIATGPREAFVERDATARLPASWHGRCVDVEAIGIEVVRTTGAGDVASAALVVAAILGMDFDDAVHLTSAAAAAHCGGQDDLRRLIESKGRS